MKKKLAIVMAAIMTLAPMNLFAASNNSTTKSIPNAGQLLFLESTWSQPGIIELDKGLGDDINYKNDDLKRAVAGGELKVVLKDTVTAGDQFKIELENADWFFKNNTSTDASTSLSALVKSTGVSGDIKHDRTSTDDKYTSNVVSFLNAAGGSFASDSTTYDHTKGVFTNNIYYRLGVSSSSASGTKLAYKLQISSTGNEAVLTVLESGVIDNEIIVPLVSLTKTDADVRVKILDSSLTTISTANIQYASGAVSATKTLVKTVEEARNSFPIDQLVIQESKINSIKNGTPNKNIVTISAPSGFTFTISDKAATTLEPGLVGINGTNTLPDPIFEVGNKYNDVIQIDTTNVKSSLNLTGKIVITGLTLVADEDAPFGDVNLKINGGDGITSETFKAAVRKDWTIDLKTITTVPTLVNGRYVSTSGLDEESSKAKDEQHLAARVSFAENSVAAWWAQRVTTFELSKGAKFRKVEIKEEKNLASMTSPKLLPNNKLNAVYIPDGSSQYATKVEGTKITISNITLVADKKASFEMLMWLSIESGVEGDVTLTATGSAIPGTIPPVVIAKAVSPITIDTKVTDIKIGYQWQKVADFTITETGVGMLERTKEVEIFLDDEISGSDGIAFAPDSSAEVIGTWKLTDFESDDGVIKFIVDRISTDKAGSVKFTNVNIKIDRTVPETNKTPYKLIVGGTAIAENYQDGNTYTYKADGKTETGALKGTKFDKFKVAGIKADYLKVVTSATNETSSFTTVVKVTIGDPVIKVGQNTMEMDTAAFIDAASASTMVPVRFIAQGLGIAENQIIWSDAARTVTIMTGARTVQFKIGSSEILVNGAAFTMTSEEGFPVKALIVEEKEGRSFIPFRALGDALGVTVGWDDSTKTATYNNDLEVK